MEQKELIRPGKKRKREEIKTFDDPLRNHLQLNLLLQVLPHQRHPRK